MERLVCSKDVGDFHVGDVMPYSDPIDITILTTLGVAKVEPMVKFAPAERPEPPRDPDEDEDDEELRMETPTPTPPSPSPTNPPNQPPPPHPPTAWDEEDQFVSRRGLKAEQGYRPRSPEEYHTRVMNEERSQSKKRRRTPK
jgi:hypothetical protein